MSRLDCLASKTYNSRVHIVFILLDVTKYPPSNNIFSIFIILTSVIKMEWGSMFSCCTLIPITKYRKKNTNYSLIFKRYGFGLSLKNLLILLMRPRMIGYDTGRDRIG